jgi:hypothetical protein
VGSINFMLQGGQYLWYSLEVHVSEPPPLTTLQVSARVREAVGIDIPLSNPAAQALRLHVKYSDPTLLGPATLTVPPGQKGVLSCFYAPVAPGAFTGSIKVVSKQVRWLLSSGPLRPRSGAQPATMPSKAPIAVRGSISVLCTGSRTNGKLHMRRACVHIRSLPLPSLLPCCLAHIERAGNFTCASFCCKLPRIQCRVQDPCATEYTLPRTAAYCAY